MAHNWLAILHITAHFMTIFGAYELEFTIHSFNVLNSSYSNTRDHFLFLCVRSANTALSNMSESNQEGCIGNETTNVTIPNSFIFTGTNWPVEGRQLYVEIQLSSGVFVDRFAINVSGNVSAFSTSDADNQIYRGLFDNAEINASLALNCTDLRCTVNRKVCIFGEYTEEQGYPMCICRPGYAGDNCERSVEKYELHVTIVEYTIASGERTCQGIQPDPRSFGLCLRGGRSMVNPQCGIGTEEDCHWINITVSDDAFGGITITLQGIGETSDEVQLNIELRGDQDQFIDRFVFKLLPLGLLANNTLERPILGIFEVATASFLVEARCTEGREGENCDLPQDITTTTTESSDTTTNFRNHIITVMVPVLSAALVIVSIIAILLCTILYRKRRASKTLVPDTTNRKLSFPNNVTEALGAHTYNCLNQRLESSTNDYHNAARQNRAGSYAIIDDEHSTKGRYWRGIKPSELDQSYEYSKEDNLYEDTVEDSLYWRPADKMTILLDQFQKLGVHSIPESDMEKLEKLGNGAFGVVYRGIWFHYEGRVQEEVAVKILEGRTSGKEMVKFLQEAAIMGQFNHPNIVQIKGIIVMEPKCEIIMELMSKGNLRNHLPTLTTRFTDQTELSSQLLYYSRQVASGMSYLSLKGYVHRDLAARNVLVSQKDICKIGDFGLSRDLNREDFYLSHGGKVPVKWTAPEALQYRLYSHTSDVWSYGCVLYEIWSLGMKPFSGQPNDDVLPKINTGYRLPPPPGCPRAIYKIMIECWNDDADSRPKFCSICSLLNLPDITTLKWSQEDVAVHSKAARTLGAPLDKGNILFSDLQTTYYAKNTLQVSVYTPN